METTIEVRGYIRKESPKEQDRDLVLIQQPLSALPQTNEKEAEYLSGAGLLLVLIAISAMINVYQRRSNKK